MSQETKSAESVASLVAKLNARAEDLAIECRKHCRGGDCFQCAVRRADETLLREAASRLSSPEGTGFDIAMAVFDKWRKTVADPGFPHPDGVRFQHMLREAFESSPSSAPAATPAKENESK